jgi:sterol desaturase/sphingolipid hydroxylase (fatty acid hydroxylase superfamily)/creatinine amidohydrolase/Fe(II)-dependent formamide hydrolase-like protein
VDYLLSRIADPFVSLFAPTHRVYWMYLCTALTLALVLFPFQGENKSGLSLKGFLKFCLPSSIYFHRSARLDYVYFIVNRIVFGLLMLPVPAAVGVVSAAGVAAALHGLWGEPSLQLSEHLGWMLLQTLLSVVAMDLGLFLAHFLQHRLPMLWEFHKVHHSAQVLTPITAYRMHPVDDVLSMSMAGLLSGVVFGLFNFLHPGGAGVIALLGLNLLLFIYYLAGYNLRHSHIWLSYGPALSRILISPAQHQIHHSKAPQHFDKNFGFIFAFWDAWLGTAYVPRAKENIEVGLAGREDEEYSGIARLYFLPFVKSLGPGVRTASVVLLVFILAGVSAQSITVVGAALAQDLGGRTGVPAKASDVPAAPVEAHRPVSIFLDDLTWTETRALVSAHPTLVIVPTGGTEQNGPHLILGKHNYIVRHAAVEIAREIGNALVAPVISYVPEGDIEPPSGHMEYAGTISIPERVFEAVLEHTARSLKTHGFKLICFLGDSGGNQKSQQRVAERLNREWRNAGVRVLHVGDYYGKNAQVEWLKDRGETDKSIGFHAGIRDTSELLFVHPDGVRRPMLKPMSSWKETGADGDPSLASAERGKALLELKVNAAVRQIKDELSRMTAERAAKRTNSLGAAVSL